MGNTPSSTEPDSVAYQDFAANYVLLRKTKDPRYGDISILEDKRTKERVALKEILCKSTADFNKEMDELMHRRKVSHPNLLRIIAYTAKAEQNICAAFYKILLIVDYFEQDFERDLILREGNGEHYTEEQLWYLLESLLSALEMLHKKGVAHGDLKPSNIFVTKFVSYKIAEQSLLGNVMPSYSQRLAGFDDVRAYLSPALIKNLAQQELYPKHDAPKSDIFTLGLTMLHAATLMSCDKFFNWEEFVLDFEALQRRIGSLSRRYSQQLQQFIGSMLALDENRRPSVNDLLKRLPNLKTQQDQQQFYQVITPISQKNNLQGKLLQPTNATPQEGNSKIRGSESKRNDLQLKKGEKTPGVTQESSRKNITTNQYGVQVGARFPLPKQVTDPSPMRPLFESNNKNLGIAIHENFTFETNKSPYRSSNSRNTSEMKKLASVQKNQYVQPDSLQSKVETFYVDYKPSTNEVSCFEFKYNDLSASKGTENVNTGSKPTYNPPNTMSLASKSTSQSSLQSQYQVSPRIEQILEYVKNRRTGKSNTEPSNSINLNLASRENTYIQSYNSLTPSNHSSNVYAFTSTYNSLTNLQQAALNQKAVSIQQEALSTSILPRQTDQPAKSNVSTLNQSRVYENDDLNSSKVENILAKPGALRDTTNLNSTNQTSFGQFITPKEAKITQKTPNEVSKLYYDKENHVTPLVGMASSGKKNTYINQQSGLTQQQNIVQQAIKTTPVQPTASNSVQAKKEALSSFQRPYCPPVKLTVEHYADGSVYEGEKQGDLRHGKGIFYYSDGGLYEGEWRAGAMEGIGTLYYAGGQVAYEGEWKEDRFNGKGIVHNEFAEELLEGLDYRNFDYLGDYWTKYEGGFADDNKEGLGVLYLSNGDRFEGEFKDDMVHGRGTYIFANQQRIVGEWWNNRFT